MKLAAKAVTELHAQGMLAENRNMLAVHRQILCIRRLSTEQEVEEWIDSAI